MIYLKSLTPAWLLTALSLAAAPALFDFDEGDTNSPTQAGWTSVKLPTLTATSAGITVSVTPVGAVTLDDRDRGTANGGGDFAALWRDFIFANGSSAEGTGMEVTLTDLEAGATYPITLWAYDKSSPNNRVAVWSANDGPSGAFQEKGTLAFNGSDATPASLESYRLDFTVTANEAGQVVLRGLKGPGGANNHNVFLTALQIGEGDPNEPEPPVTGQKLQLSEFLASNATGLRDGFGNRSDWIEIYNPNSEAVDLTGWSLTDNLNQPAKWVFPEGATIPAKSWLVVFASGASLSGPDPQGYYHTSFSLSASGEPLALFRPDTAEPEDVLEMFPPQSPDITYGRLLSTGEWKYLATPTPGAANAAQGYEGVIAPLTFSVTRGFFEEPFELALSTPTEGVVIHYTLDSSVPSATSPVYTSPIPITGTTVVRAVALKAGWLSPKVATHTYIFPDQVVQQPAAPEGFPTTWGTDSEVNNNDGPRNGTVPADYEMDPRVQANALPGYGVKEALLDIPTLSLVLPRDDLFHSSTGIYARPLMRGPAWEREGSLELIFPDGTDGFQENAIVEIHGNSSRRPWRMQKHSFRITFRGSVGATKLRYPIFPDSPLDRWDQIILRACFTDSWGLVSWDPARYRPNDSQYLRDVWMKESFKDMGQPSTHGTFCHLYVDGLYWGLHNPTERLNATYFVDRFGGQEEDWELNADFESPGPRWAAMMAVPTWEAIQTHLDVENFADYMLLHFFADAEDWPHHNGYAATCPAIGFPWRFFVWDQEIVLDNHQMNRFDVNTGAGALFQKLRSFPEFRLLFADRVNKHLFNGGALTAEVAGQRYLALAQIIDKAIVAESARWGDTRSSLPYGTSIQQPSPLDNVNHANYPPAPNGPNFFFTREQSWLVERDNIVNNYLPAIHDTTNSFAFIRKLRSRNLWPSVEPPVFSQHGGAIGADGLTLEISHPGATGTVYYTLDGTDPRESPSGTPRGTLYTAPLSLHQTCVVKARVYQNGTWSALTEARFTAEVPAAADNLVISEIHYAPPAEQALSEFVELRNVSTTPLDLSGVTFVEGISFTFPPQTTLAPDARLVLVRDAAAFAAVYGEDVPVFGQYEGALDNAGETLRLVAADGRLISEITYSPQAPWPTGALGGGYSLTLREGVAPADATHPAAWRESATLGGSPGSSDARPYTLGPPDADDNGDGIPNLIQYALLSGPELKTEPPGAWTLQFTRHAGADAAALSVEVSSDLQTWQPLEATPLVTRDGQGWVETWPLPSPGTAPCFVRLRATLRP